MNSRRTVILVAAIVVGALATYVLLNYVRGVEDRAKPNPVQVYTITDLIKRGSSGTEVKAAIKKTTIPGEFRPDTYVADLTEIDGKVAVVDLAPNQVLVKGMFVEAERANTTFKDKITGDNVAVALPFDAVRAVGGFVKPGDEVNIMMVVPWAEAAEAATPAAGGAATDFRRTARAYTRDARNFYEKVKILAIGSDVLRSPGEAIATTNGAKAAEAANTSGGMVILMVPQEAAQRLLAADPSTLYMTLPSETWKPVPVPAIPTNEFPLSATLPGEDAGKLTPYGPNGFTDKTSVARVGETTPAPTTTR